MLAAGLALASGVSAQNHEVPCKTDMYNGQMTTPEVAEAHQLMEARLATQRTKTDDTSEIVIPVVFHIIHNNGPENISDALIEEQMLTINESFNKGNKDQSLIRTDFQPLVADAHIRFELAKQDPDGNCTNGIERIVSTSTYNAPDDVKYLSIWDSRYYLNIWVVNTIAQSPDLQGTLAGYATFPWIAMQNREKDGIMVGYKFIGRPQKTLPHEIGHYLGLFHTFEGSCASSQTAGGDYVDDTPPVSEASFGWDLTANTCHSDFPDMPDMIENFMDYADKKFLFTPGQVERMRKYVSNYRPELISKANIRTALTSPCLTGIEPAPASLEGLSIYPNPARGHVAVNISSAKPQLANVSLVDMNGKVIYSEGEQELSTGGNSLPLGASGLRPGIYFVQVQTEDAVLKEKLIIAE